MIEKTLANRKIEQLFGGWEEGILWACLQGVMGGIYVDCMERPQSAMAVLGDFAFFAGIPNEELIKYRPNGSKQNFIIMVPQNDAWGQLIQKCCGEKAKKVLRYAIKKEPHVFDVEKLRLARKALKSGFVLKMIDEELYYKCRQNDWSRDLVSQFKNYETYRRLGLGAVILNGDELVSGASSYARYNGGIEIEIDTKERYRRQGLAYICGAKLILECLERGLYPSWDAQNPWSVALAEKLGYSYSHTYTAYEIWG